MTCLFKVLTERSHYDPFERRPTMYEACGKEATHKSEDGYGLCADHAKEFKQMGFGVTPIAKEGGAL